MIITFPVGFLRLPTMIGCVTQVIRSRACGFIRAENGQHVFFHARDLHHTTFDELEEHQSVQFSFVPDAISGPRAIHVEVDRRRLRAVEPKRERPRRRSAVTSSATPASRQ